ncbi:hypothetical protein IW261DRAFT_1575388 [Armillaria novae-zelandiae]|uniref:Uncharacterized protein n=1 Tax=Armillaria novae-zelandiae TaxID=153914 RepID=A0AA39NEC8_9AGAR|nr:hypothetical protein IW261DRAFT_1575388 [Armillaria novae-zelandiae]
MEAEAAAAISIEQYLGSSPPPIAPVRLMPSNPHLESDTFCFRPMVQVPMGWGETEGAVLIRWAFNAIWFCISGFGAISLFFTDSGRTMPVLCANALESVLELERRPAFAKCARRSPRVCSAMQQMLRITYHGPPKLLKANTESESKEMAEPAAGPEVSRASLPTGDMSSSDEEGEEGIEQDAQASVAEEELIGEATNAGVEERSPTPPGLDARSLGSETPLAGQKCVVPASPVPPVAAGEDAREPPLKKAKGKGQTQPAMRANMEAMQDEGLLLAASTKCDCCKAASSCSSRIPADLDNGCPLCAECLISSHSCPSCLVRLPMIPKVPTAHRQVIVTVPHIGKVAHEYQRIEGSQMNLHLPIGGDSTTDFAFGLVERLGLRSHPHEATWDRIVAASKQIIAGYHALQYELQNYGPFNEADVEHLLTNRLPVTHLQCVYTCNFAKCINTCIA